MAKKKTVSFDEYKAVKDEIIEISEQRFENLLTMRLREFKKEFKDDLMNEINPRFDAINARFGSVNTRFDSLEEKFRVFMWIYGVSMTIVISLIVAGIVK